MCFFAGGLRFSEQGFGLSMRFFIGLPLALIETLIKSRSADERDSFDH